MEAPFITATGAVIAACIAFSGALHVAMRSQRHQAKSLRDNWVHDRCKDAYLGFLDAARAFAPLTEEAIRSENRNVTAAGVAMARNPQADMFHETWVGDVPPVDALSEGFYKRAPKRLHGLAVAYERIAFEGPSDVAAKAREIIDSAHRLSAGPELFAREAKEQIDPDHPERPSPNEVDLLRTEINSYEVLIAEFRRQAKKALTDAGGPHKS
ncbi:hypothetical protein [Streptomyces sp. MMBL 11-3]|uniref:hypothetical protein n=1 Tax=Streptomyces sp. MMBL 11-3 TaxID=3382639 RepID=UPI0039B6CC5B